MSTTDEKLAAAKMNPREAQRILDEKYPRVRRVGGGDDLPARMTDDELREWAELATIAASPMSDEEKAAASRHELQRFEQTIRLMEASFTGALAGNPYGVDIRCPICGIHFDATGLRQHLFSEGPEGDDIAREVCRRDVWGHAHFPEHWERYEPPEVVVGPVGEIPAEVQATIAGLMAKALELAPMVKALGAELGEVSNLVLLHSNDLGHSHEYNAAAGMCGLAALDDVLSTLSAWVAPFSDTTAYASTVDELVERYGQEARLGR